MTNRAAIPQGVRRRRRRVLLLALVAMLLAAVMLAASAVQRSLAWRVRGALVDALDVDPDAVVSVEDVRVSLTSRRIEVRGLGIADRDGLRFARVARASVSFGLGSLRRGVVEIPRVLLEGLDVRVDSIVLAAFRSESGGEGPGPLTPKAAGSRFVVRRVDVRNARILLLDDRGREQFAGRIETAGIDNLGTREHPMAGEDVVRLAAARILEAAGLAGAQRVLPAGMKP